MPTKIDSKPGEEGKKDKTLDLNDTGADDVDTTTEDDDAEDDLALDEGIVKGAEGDNDDEDVQITVKRGSLKKVIKTVGAAKNYKKVALAAKKGEKKVGDKKPAVTTPAKPAADEFITRKEVFDQNEKDAIKAVTTADSKDDAETIAKKKEINDNWNEIVKFYSNRSGKNKVENIIEDIFDAYTLWLRKNADKSAGDKTARREVSTDRGIGGKSQTGAAPKRTRVLPSNTPISTWYKGADKPDKKA